MSLENNGEYPKCLFGQQSLRKLLAIEFPLLFLFYLLLFNYDIYYMRRILRIFGTHYLCLRQFRGIKFVYQMSISRKLNEISKK